MILAPRRELDVAVGKLALDCGQTLENVVQHVSCYGAEPHTDGSNIVYVAHALTGSSHVTDWWAGFVGPGLALDTDRLAIISANVLGGCYGSTGPASLAADGEPYGSRFPVISVGDMVRAQSRAMDELGIGPMAGVVGGSLGAMQSLQWIMQEPTRFRHGILMGAYDFASSFVIALNALSRAAIMHDEHFAGGDYYKGPAPHEGLRLARMIAMVTYKSEALIEERFGRRFDRKGGDPSRQRLGRFDVEGYLEYQGQKFVQRMDAHSYLALTRATDLFDVRDLATPVATTQLTFVGIDSDWRFPARYIREAAQRFTKRGFDTEYLELHSTHGHDAFLADLEDLTYLTAARLEPLYRSL